MDQRIINTEDKREAFLFGRLNRQQGAAKGDNPYREQGLAAAWAEGWEEPYTRFDSSARSSEGPEENVGADQVIIDEAEYDLLVSLAASVEAFREMEPHNDWVEGWRKIDRIVSSHIAYEDYLADRVAREGRES